MGLLGWSYAVSYTHLDVYKRQTRGNLLRQYVGSQDHPLAPEGVALAERRRGEMPPIDGLWVSPMLRCRQTAEILFPGVEQRLVDALKECDLSLIHIYAIFNPNDCACEQLNRKMAEYAKAVVDGRPQFHISLVRCV